MLKATVTAVAAVAGVVLGGVVAGLGRLAGGTKDNPGTAHSQYWRPATELA